MSNHRFAWRLSFVLIASWILSATSISEAQPLLPEGVAYLPEQQPALPNPPTPQATARHGLKLMVDTRWADGYGYRPVKFRFMLPQKSANAISLAIRFHVSNGVSQQPRLSVEQSGTIVRGETSATVIVRVPQYESWGSVTWDIWVDGAKEPTLSLDQSQPLGINHWQQGGLTLYYPRLSTAATSFASTAPTGESFAGLPVNRSVGPLPTNWLDFTCLDAVVMTNDDFIAASKSGPNGIEALKSWIAAGGNLWIEHTSMSTERLQAIDERLQLDAQLMSPQRESNAPELPGAWSLVKMQSTDNDGSALDRSNNSDLGMKVETERSFEFAPDLLNDFLPGISEQTDTRNWFAERPAGLGTVTAFVGKWDDNPNNLARGVRGLVRERWVQRSWLMRHGFAPNIPTLDFSNFLIPGVGLAPVVEFRVLITIFVLLIGPINYWVLSRAKRLYLLALTVPLGAAAVTLLLFSYAFLADGFATQVRTRSFTLLDQPTGNAVSWARQSYYSGFAPAEGLYFPDDTAIYPILSEAGGFRSRANVDERQLEWVNRDQVLSQGWLASRTPTQFLAIRSHESLARLEVRIAADRCQVTNHFGVPLTWLLVIDEAGNKWHEAEIAPDERVALNSSPSVEELRFFRETLLANRPQLPTELQEMANAARSDQQRNRGRRRSGMSRFSDQEPEFRLSMNFMEKRFEALAEALAGSAGIEFPPRSYVAVTSTSIEIPIALDDAEEVDGFHVIMGRW